MNRMFFAMPTLLEGTAGDELGRLFVENIQRQTMHL